MRSSGRILGSMWRSSPAWLGCACLLLMGCTDPPADDDSDTPADTPPTEETPTPTATPAGETPTPTATPGDETPTPTATPAGETPTATPEGTTVPPRTDADEDGVPLEDGDCDDEDPSVYPGATEVPYDGIDQDCAGGDLVDADGDGFAASALGGDDCDDTDPDIHPDADEIEDDIDNDCDDAIDEGLETNDDDLDGQSEEEGDCDDGNPEVYTGAGETCDGLDENCNGVADEEVQSTWYYDGDEDGYGNPETMTRSCEAPAGFIAQGGDCNDGNAAASPAATETPAQCADGIDQDCNGQDLSCDTLDRDGDGAAPVDGDCNDSDSSIHPDGDEAPGGNPDGKDNDCDGRIDEGTVAFDDDGDGFSEKQGDCDDTNPQARPGLPEASSPDQVDNDCDGVVDEGTVAFDDDGDGSSEAEGDCNDADSSVAPDAVETCNSRDDDCDGEKDEGATRAYYLDADRDGYGAGTAIVACTPPSEVYVERSGDCNDREEAAYPGATEVCDGIDNDCDSTKDEGVLEDWFFDEDGDGYGDDTRKLDACTAPTADYVAEGGDCDDEEPTLNPGETDLCDDFDRNCDGEVAEDADGDGYSDAECGGSDCDDSNASIRPEAGKGCALGTSCLDLYNQNYRASGIYTIDVDGYGTGALPFDVFCDQVTAGGGWTRIYYQSTEDGQFFLATDFELNKADPMAKRYAILNDLEKFRRDGGFEFKMDWPKSSFTDYQHWFQTSNPVTDSPGAIPTGYRGIHIPYTHNGWASGLQRSANTTYSLLDGTMSPLTNWYYAVGTTYAWNSVPNAQPGPTGGVAIAELWVR